MALKRLVATTILLLAATLAPAGATDAAKSMSEAERAAFRAEVHDYLLANPEVLMEMLALLDARQKAAADKSDAALVSENKVLAGEVEAKLRELLLSGAAPVEEKATAAEYAEFEAENEQEFE